MLRRILLASASALALSGAAVAADLPTGAPPPVYLPPPPIFTWTGLYLGGQVGYKWGRDNGDITCTSFFPGGANSFTPDTASLTGAIGGAHIGYNWQIAQFVLGIETDVDATNFNGHSFAIDEMLSPSNGITTKLRSSIEGSVRGRIGWAWDRWLLYGTGGIAFTDVKSDYSVFVVILPLFDSRTSTRTGWTAGGGIEYAVTPNWLFGVEYRYSDFGRFTDTGLFGIAPPNTPAVEIDAHHHLTQHRVQARVSYKFDWWSPVVAKF